MPLVDGQLQGVANDVLHEGLFILDFAAEMLQTLDGDDLRRLMDRLNSLVDAHIAQEARRQHQAGVLERTLAAFARQSDFVRLR